MSAILSRRSGTYPIMHIAPCGRTLRTSTLSSGSGSLRGWFIRASFDHLHLVIDHPISRVPDAPQPHLSPTVRTPQRISTGALLVALPVGQPGENLHRALADALHLGQGRFNHHLHLAKHLPALLPLL